MEQGISAEVGTNVAEPATSQTLGLDLQRKERVELQLGGFGGQGIILAAYILGRAATVHAGHNAVMSQSYGPESRGGACMAGVVISSDEVIAYPRVVSPDVLVIMSQEAYGRYGRNRPDTSLLIVDEDLVTLDGGREERQVLGAPATRLAEELGRRIIANIVMLGFVCGVTNLVSVETMREAVHGSVPKGTEELNLQAVERGYGYAQELLSQPQAGGAA